MPLVETGINFVIKNELESSRLYGCGNESFLSSSHLIFLDFIQFSYRCSLCKCVSIYVSVLTVSAYCRRHCLCPARGTPRCRAKIYDQLTAQQKQLMEQSYQRKAEQCMGADNCFRRVVVMSRYISQFLSSNLSNSHQRLSMVCFFFE